jgi:DNA-binding NtrC family response regulator
MEPDKNICPVLIIDDDNDLCLILERIITDKYSIHVEHNLRNAESYLTKQEPSVILLDNNLPDGTGVTSIKDILKDHPGIKIVLMTADDSKGLKDQAIREGAAIFITKPFRASMINEILFSLCPGSGPPDFI